MRRRLQAFLIHKKTTNTNRPATEPPTALSQQLADALPDSTVSPPDPAFWQLLDSYWAQQECQVVPCCFVKPRDLPELCAAVRIIKREYDEPQRRGYARLRHSLFAIRSGGHSPVPRAASIKGGVVIDLGCFNEVTVVNRNGEQVAIMGSGAKWMDVSTTLEEQGLAVVGGRNSAVGVGGLTLGGGLSFFSPRFGFVCSNILSYEVVLASGDIVTASSSENPDLWRALKGGSNNFGIVTRFTARCFPSSKIWSGFLYMPAFQTTKVLAAFHESLNAGISNVSNTVYDEHAAGPMVAFSYIQALRAQLISVNLVYTKLPESEKKWPACWKSSGFASLWRLWSTCKVRTLTSATDESDALNAPGRRQCFATTTVKNDPATLTAVHKAYHDAIAPLRQMGVKGLVWTLAIQPLLPAWARKGEVNPLGLSDCPDHESLVIVSFTVNWDERRNDDSVKATTRRAIEQMDAFAVAHRTGHPWRYLNYCGAWQRPFPGYGADNWRFLRETSRKYDPDRLFQEGCVGGFKLGWMDEEYQRRWQIEDS